MKANGDRCVLSYMHEYVQSEIAKCVETFEASMCKLLAYRPTIQWGINDEVVYDLRMPTDWSVFSHQT